MKKKMIRVIKVQYFLSLRKTIGMFELEIIFEFFFLFLFGFHGICFLFYI